VGINETPRGQLGKYLIGDLGVARRHIQRIRQGVLPASGAVMAEISRSVEDCVARIARDIQDDPEDGITMEEILHDARDAERIADGIGPQGG
jgi:hypothetical protein